MFGDTFSRLIQPASIGFDQYAADFETGLQDENGACL